MLKRKKRQRNNLKREITVISYSNLITAFARSSHSGGLYSGSLDSWVCTLWLLSGLCRFVSGSSWGNVSFVVHHSRASAAFPHVLNVQAIIRRFRDQIDWKKKSKNHCFQAGAERAESLLSERPLHAQYPSAKQDQLTGTIVSWLLWR